MVLFISGLDGCFVKLTTGQQILAATGRDGNNNIYPITFGLVDKEDKASWSWFLTQLKYQLGGEEGNFGKYTFISDRHKVQSYMYHLMYTNKDIVDHNNNIGYLTLSLIILI